MRASIIAWMRAGSSTFWTRTRIRTSARARSSLQPRAPTGSNTRSCCSASFAWEWEHVPCRRPAEPTTARGRSGCALRSRAPDLRAFVQRKDVLELRRRKSADADFEHIAGFGIGLHRDDVERILEGIAF